MACGTIKFVINSPFQIICECFQATHAKTRKNQLSLVGNPVSVIVPEVPQVGCRNDKQPPLVACHTGGVRQLVNEDPMCLVETVTVHVKELAHTPLRSFRRFTMAGVIPHLTDVKATILIVDCIDRIHYGWFMRHQFKMKSGFQLK
jgi:hypothetical protein